MWNRLAIGHLPRYTYAKNYGNKSWFDNVIAVFYSHGRTAPKSCRPSERLSHESTSRLLASTPTVTIQYYCLGLVQKLVLIFQSYRMWKAESSTVPASVYQPRLYIRLYWHRRHLQWWNSVLVSCTRHTGSRLPLHQRRCVMYATHRQQVTTAPAPLRHVRDTQAAGYHYISAVVAFLWFWHHM